VVVVVVGVVVVGAVVVGAAVVDVPAGRPRVPEAPVREVHAPVSAATTSKAEMGDVRPRRRGPMSRLWHARSAPGSRPHQARFCAQPVRLGRA
jgi:hypothetical protein